jgi:hypothetical protein
MNIYWILMKDDNELCVGVRNSNSDTWCVLYSDGSTDSAVSESQMADILKIPLPAITKPDPPNHMFTSNCGIEPTVEEVDMYKRGDRIMAIKSIRTRTQCGLKEGKEAIDMAVEFERRKKK